MERQLHEYLNPWKKKKIIFDKQFNNGVMSKLGGYQISVMSSLRVAPFSGNVPAM
jgi:hypothetical protein